ncbi:MAG: multicopper oxidase domain-containing protein [bacterium]
MKRDKRSIQAIGILTITLTALLLLLPMPNAEAVIDGLTGNSFNLKAKADHISTPIGGSLLIWGYANGDDRAQYPGPTLILNQGETITVNLTNELDIDQDGDDIPDMNVSIVFPGQENVVACGGTSGLLTREATFGGTVSYTFTATHAGTYLYHSGTSPEIQVEMGLLGAIIVRPSGFNPDATRAYNHPDAAYDHEYLFLLSEMDPRIHETVEFCGVAALKDTDFLSDYFPNYWFINGRNAPDTMLMAYVPWLPTQPYNCMPRMHPGERLLMRVIGAGRDLHPFHFHGNHARIIAKDGRLLESSPGLGADLSYELFTIQSIPGETVDAIFEWTGKGLGWDIYGHEGAEPGICEGYIPGDLATFFDPVTKEYCPDHGKPFPVSLPEELDLTFGRFYSGSPFLGTLGNLPPGEGGVNPTGGFVFMWHSHTEKEMTNYNIYPGGMMTMLIIEPPDVPIP